jgi:valyl-tRNA synthetase
LYDFFWSDYCDWYLEMVKPRVDREHYGEHACTPESTQTARDVLATVLEGTLKLLHPLLHPFIPFITEGLWEKIPKSDSASTHVMVSSWPEKKASYNNAKAAQDMTVFQEIVTKLRTIRSEMGIPVTQPIELFVKPASDETAQLIERHATILKCLNSRVGKIQIDKSAARPNASAAAVVPGATLYVPLEGLIDFAKERARLEKELMTLSQDAERLLKKMSNQDFITHAPADEVEKTKTRLNETKERIRHLGDNISTLS